MKMYVTRMSDDILAFLRTRFSLIYSKGNDNLFILCYICTLILAIRTLQTKSWGRFLSASIWWSSSYFSSLSSLARDMWLVTPWYNVRRGRYSYTVKHLCIFNAQKSRQLCIHSDQYQCETVKNRSLFSPTLKKEKPIATIGKKKTNWLSCSLMYVNTKQRKIIQMLHGIKLQRKGLTVSYTYS